MKEIITSDMLVYISGGYFGERDASLKENLIRFLRYVLIGGVFILRKKPIAIIGVGGGPLKNPILRKSFCKLINSASLVTVRDDETANYFKSYGVKNEMLVTSDTAQIIKQNTLPLLDEVVQRDVKRIFKNKK
ncbi:hypothetical protein Q73_13480 [Bacillus coahuilensis m2-6]|uniref:polysaccharide pyruvyl transferase family protein n=1 Tax=Bacillus coahuilensis TaxID=408580 RepID=UPI0007503A50|nr:polysaccharide pyruvyl transferase family protein [Bacillus coahuilensis]KUP05273.1 hypothetical protein Q73_13480 [Bacillus coahuilensis m2-6]